MYLSLERSIPYSGANAPTRPAYNVWMRWGWAMAVMPTKSPQRQRRYRQIASISFNGKLNYNMLGRGIYVFNFSNLSFQLLHVFLVDAYHINLKLETLLYFQIVLQLPHTATRLLLIGNFSSLIKTMTSVQEFRGPQRYDMQRNRPICTSMSKCCPMPLA
jgi:hypothetical protein